jgi:hypothetical protein
MEPAWLLVGLAFLAVIQLEKLRHSMNAVRIILIGTDKYKEELERIKDERAEQWKSARAIIIVVCAIAILVIAGVAWSEISKKRVAGAYPWPTQPQQQLEQSPPDPRQVYPVEKPSQVRPVEFLSERRLPMPNAGNAIPPGWTPTPNQARKQ